MLGHFDATRRNDNCRGRRDVERAGTIAARSAGVAHLAIWSRDLHRVLAHRTCKADELGGPLALHAQCGEERRERGRGHAAVHDFSHGVPGLIHREVLVTNELLDERRQHSWSV